MLIIPVNQVMDTLGAIGNTKKDGQFKPLGGLQSLHFVYTNTVDGLKYSGTDDVDMSIWISNIPNVTEANVMDFAVNLVGAENIILNVTTPVLSYDLQGNYRHVVIKINNTSDLAIGDGQLSCYPFFDKLNKYWG